MPTKGDALSSPAPSVTLVLCKASEMTDNLRDLMRGSWKDSASHRTGPWNRRRIIYIKIVTFPCTPEFVSWTPNLPSTNLINFHCLPPHWPCALCSSHPLLLSDSLSPSIFSPSCPFILFSFSRVLLQTFPLRPALLCRIRETEPRSEGLVRPLPCHRPFELRCRSRVSWCIIISLICTFPPVALLQSPFVSILGLRTPLWFH